jgi:hypothetical protein
MLKYEKIKDFILKLKFIFFVFEEAYKTLRTANDKEERLMLVEHWLDFEVGNEILFSNILFFLL